MNSEKKNRTEWKRSTMQFREKIKEKNNGDEIHWVRKEKGSQEKQAANRVENKKEKEYKPKTEKKHFTSDRKNKRIHTIWPLKERNKEKQWFV